MSDMDKKLEKAIQKLAIAQEKLAAAQGTLAAHMSICVVVGTEQVQDIRLRAIDALTRGCERYAAATLGLSDQMKAEIEELKQE